MAWHDKYPQEEILAVCDALSILLNMKFFEAYESHLMERLVGLSGSLEPSELLKNVQSFQAQKEMLNRMKRDATDLIALNNTHSQE